MESRVTRNKVMMFTENRDGKVYIVFQDGTNHICGQVAIGDQNLVMRDAQMMMPEELLERFLAEGYKGMGR